MQDWGVWRSSGEKLHSLTAVCFKIIYFNLLPLGGSIAPGLELFTCRGAQSIQTPLIIRANYLDLVNSCWTYAVKYAVIQPKSANSLCSLNVRTGRLKLTVYSLLTERPSSHCQCLFQPF